MVIKDNTAGVLQEVDRRISKGLNEIAPDVVASAKEVVVVVTGRLQRSIVAKISERKAVIGSPLVYASKIEMNKPYLRVALESTMTKIKRIFKI